MPSFYKRQRPFSAKYAYAAGGRRPDVKGAIFFATVERYTINIPGVHTTTWGTMSAAKEFLGALASQKKGGRFVVAGGFLSTSVRVNNIEYIETRSGGPFNVFTTFGVLTSAKAAFRGSSDANIGLFCGGNLAGDVITNEVERINIASASNSVLSGSLSTAVSYYGSYADSKNSYVVVGATAGGGALNAIQTRPLKSAATFNQFNSIWTVSSGLFSASFVCNERVGLKAGGDFAVDTMEAVSLKSLSSGKSFGSLPSPRTSQSSASSQTTAMFIKGSAGGNTGSSAPFYVFYKSMNEVNSFGALGLQKSGAGGYGGS